MRGELLMTLGQFNNIGKILNARCDAFCEYTSEYTQYLGTMTEFDQHNLILRIKNCGNVIRVPRDLWETDPKK